MAQNLMEWDHVAISQLTELSRASRNCFGHFESRGGTEWGHFCNGNVNFNQLNWCMVLHLVHGSSILVLS